MKKCMVFGILLVSLTGFACSLMANEAPVRAVGKTIQPRDDVPVRLVSENVRIMLSSKGASVHCEFNLLNEGPPDTVQVGFPRGWESDFDYFGAGTYGMNFKVTTLPVDPNFSEISGEEMPWWKVFSVPFDSTGKKITVFNDYAIRVNPFGLSTFSDLYFKYIVKTGAYWKDTIQDAQFRIRLINIPFDQITKISPEGFTLEGDTVTWHFTDFEPVADIEIFIMNDVRYERMVAAKKFLEDNPNSAFGHFLLGTAYFTEDIHNPGYEIYGGEKSEKEFLKALELDPDNLDARWYLAAVYHIRKQEEKSKKLVEEIIAKKPDYYCTDKLYPGVYDIMPFGSAQGWLEELNRMNR
ncbi:hypothetical protein LLG96_01705 [bacterium]|nr:hypothetical protein [bacterium]